MVATPVSGDRPALSGGVGVIPVIGVSKMRHFTAIDYRKSTHLPFA
jgi:hypothetical protein